MTDQLETPDNTLTFPAPALTTEEPADERTLLELLQEEAARRAIAGELLADMETEALALPEWEDTSPAAVVKRLAFLLDMAHVPPGESLERRFDDMARRYAANIATRNAQVQALAGAIGDALYLINTPPGRVKRAASVLTAALHPRTA